LAFTFHFFVHGSWPLFILCFQANACATPIRCLERVSVACVLVAATADNLAALLLTILRSLSSRLHREQRGSMSADELPLHFSLTSARLSFRLC
jgi:hypothetical protein